MGSSTKTTSSKSAELAAESPASAPSESQPDAKLDRQSAAAAKIDDRSQTGHEQSGADSSSALDGCLPGASPDILPAAVAQDQRQGQTASGIEQASGGYASTLAECLPDAAPSTVGRNEVEDRTATGNDRTSEAASSTLAESVPDAVPDTVPSSGSDEFDRPSLWPWIILQATESVGRPILQSCNERLDQGISLCILEADDSFEEVGQDYLSLLHPELKHVDVTVISFAQSSKHRSFCQQGITMRRLDGRMGAAAVLESLQHTDFVCIPVGLLERWYYVAPSLVRALAQRGALLFVAELPHCKSDSVVSAALLHCFGCNVHQDPNSSPFFFCTDRDSCVPSGKDNDQANQSCLRDDLLDSCYVMLRQTLSRQALDFRPLHPSPDASDSPRAAAAAAFRGWRATGAAVCDAAVAAGMASGEAALATLLSAGQRGPSCIEEAVCKGVQGVLEAGGSENRAAAVGALLGLREGMYAWDACRPLENHGAQVASVLGIALVEVGVWRKFPEEIRRKKILELTRAGGLERPGECTIALIQALLGVSRPKGGSRLVAAMTVLRQVSQILLVAATLPNLLDRSSAEVKTFSNLVLENMDMSRLHGLLNDDDVQPE